MRKMTIAIVGAVVLLFAGLLAWNSGATTLTGALTAEPGTSHSLIEKIACFRQGLFCPPGLIWRNGECVPCPRILECDASKGECLYRTATGALKCKVFPRVPPKSNCPRL